MRATRFTWIWFALRVGLLVFAAVAPAVAQPVPATTEYYHVDALGSVRVVTDAGGAVLRHYDYGPFGEQDSPCTTSPDRRLFTGQQRDRETCLDYFGARHYRSTLGRFLSIDPALDQDAARVDPQRWNRYAYARNNPTKFTDPDGKNPLLVLGGIAWGIYEVGSAAYDVYNAVTTVNDPSASRLEKDLAIAGAAVSVFGPGGGYGKAATTAVETAESGFRSFGAFKRAFGPAGDDMDWHHIVGQTSTNVGQFGAEAIHSTRNLIPVPKGLHWEINRLYSSIQSYSRGMTVRQWLHTLPFSEQRRFGLEQLRRLGVTIPE